MRSIEGCGKRYEGACTCRFLWDTWLYVYYSKELYDILFSALLEATVKYFLRVRAGITHGPLGSPHG